MVWENHKNTIAAACELGLTPPLIQTLREQLPRLDPVQIGSSGQVKEFREERKYGEIGESTSPPHLAFGRPISRLLHHKRNAGVDSGCKGHAQPPRR